MRINIYSELFSPSIGGMQRLMETLATEFVRQGHQVSVITETPGEDNLPYPVFRRPSFWDRVWYAKEADVILSAPLSLRQLPAQLLAMRPIIVAHPILYGTQGRQRVIANVKRTAARLVTSVVPSQFMARHFARATVIPNPYDSSLFVAPKKSALRTNLLFVGRLDSEKGCDVLISAFANAKIGSESRLAIVGDGPELGLLKQLCEKLRISERVEFQGELSGIALAEVMQTHRIMVVPTICEEAFGIVALEGLASGCRMIIAESGGLPEAVGDFALRFPRGDVAKLAACLEVAFGAEDEVPSQVDVDAHLKNFTPEKIASQYLALLKSA